MQPTLRRHTKAYRRRRTRRFILRCIAFSAVGAVLAVGLRGYGIRSFDIPSESMAPTLRVGERILVDEFTPLLTGYHRGDIIVFTDPGWGTASAYTPDVWQRLGVRPEGGKYLTKRIVGVPGDHVEGRADGVVFVNNVPFDEGFPAPQRPFELTLQEGEFWVMGDNRDSSGDSRFYGPIPDESLIGRTVAVYFPPSGMRLP